MELKYPEYHYEEVHPRTLLTHIIANAEPESVLDVKQLKALRDTTLTFNGDKNSPRSSSRSEKAWTT